jgi:hypothetical protein
MLRILHEEFIMRESSRILFIFDGLFNSSKNEGISKLRLIHFFINIKELDMVTESRVFSIPTDLGQIVNK